jgi:hypothetical protein
MTQVDFVQDIRRATTPAELQWYEMGARDYARFLYESSVISEGEMIRRFRVISTAVHEWVDKNGLD